MNTKKHYDELLSGYYSWMSGGAEKNVPENMEFFRSHGISPTDSRSALDLGAGAGYQAIPLAMAGFRVTAVDFSPRLLKEIDSERYGIEAIEADILDFPKYAGRKPALVVCMGDTLTHLPDMESARRLIGNSWMELAPGGRLVLTFRDYTSQLQGPRRFIPVRSGEDLIFTCFLEYGAHHVDVYDIVNRRENGAWLQEISSYRKIIISSGEISAMLEESGFQVELCDKSRGIITVIGRKNL